MSLTQYQKILTLMARNRYKWWYPYDFMDEKLGHLFVGYKAPTRISELAAEYPLLFEEKHQGKYVLRRLRGEKFPEWYPTLSKDLKQVIAKELNYYPHIPQEAT